MAESLPSRARVLDLGCGTGRYFHCFTESATIVGVDICRPMLERARQPVGGARAHLALVESTLHDVAFQPASFDAILCMGVFGNNCPFDPFIAATLARWLIPTGVLHCDIVERHIGPASATWRSRLALWVAPYLHGRAQAYVEAKLHRFTRQSPRCRGNAPRLIQLRQHQLVHGRERPPARSPLHRRASPLECRNFV